MVDHQKSGTNAKPGIKQVEFNTIASSFGGLASKVSALHRYEEQEFPISFLSDMMTVIS